MDMRDPTPAEVLLRGLGWGAAAGGAGAFLLWPLVALGQGDIDATTLLFAFVTLGMLTAPLGAAFGAVAGVAVACAVSLAAPPSRSLPKWVLRVLGGTCGPAVVVGCSALLFQPSLSIGANEDSGHVTERVLLFLAIPGTLALVAAVLFTPSLIRPVVRYAPGAGNEPQLATADPEATAPP